MAHEVPMVEHLHFNLPWQKYSRHREHFSNAFYRGSAYHCWLVHMVHTTVDVRVAVCACVAKFIQHFDVQFSVPQMPMSCEPLRGEDHASRRQQNSTRSTTGKRRLQ